MVYPAQGFSSNFVKHIPLSLLYAVTEIIKSGVDVDILDNRLCPHSWKEELKKKITPLTLVIGISVISGTPIRNAVEISRFVKSIDPGIRVVWGGPHATFFPEGILEDEPSCDYVISGCASKSFKMLVDSVIHGTDPFKIPGLSYRSSSGVMRVPSENQFEFIRYQDIPYHLIADYKVYGQLDQDRIIFSMYSVMGCPYQCAFCSSPAQYRQFPRRYVPFPVQEVVDHIDYVIKKYQANYIYFIDDDSFVDLSHVESIIDEIGRRGIKVGLGFRGARINEIKKMSDEFIEKLIAHGTDIMHIGAESGSDRILTLIHKDCTVADILEINRKLARHPKLIAAYNFIMGLPTETLEDLKGTRDLMLALVRDNPRCVIFQPNKFRPLPGTELFDHVREQYGFHPPEHLSEWAHIEAEGHYSYPWHSKGMKEFMDMLLVGSYFIDNKALQLKTGSNWIYKLFRMIHHLYGPLAKFRFRYGWTKFLMEYQIYRFVTRIVLKTKSVDLFHPPAVKEP
jgi:radical SAM superfamily enzyme YgiQ (UPF0313 family)